MKTLTLEQIKTALPSVDLMHEIESGFVAYSQGKAVVPPVGELVLQEPPGDVHIKYGYILGDDYYVVKIASGFYENAKLGLPSSNGLMLMFKQNSGELAAVLLDEGYLTDIRTAVAGAIAAKYLAPSKIDRIGIVGTGTQARLQLEYLAPVIECRDVVLWGRNQSRLTACADDMLKKGFRIATTLDMNELTQTCNLIVTTTPSTQPLVNDFSLLRPGTHITAMGSDTADKQELDSSILQHADRIIADSIPQCIERGEIHQALKKNAINKDSIVELGSIVDGVQSGRISDDDITVADLTGVAVQDIKIASAVYAASA